MDNRTEISDETLKMIEEAAGLCFTPAEVAIMVEIDTYLFDSLMDDSSSDVFKRFMKGKLQAEVDIRKRVFQMADSGSAPAQNTVLRLLEDQNVKMTN